MLGIPFAGSSSAHSHLLSDLNRLALDASNIGSGVGEHAADEDLPYARRLRPSLQDIKAPSSERRPGLAPDYLPMVVRAVLPYLETECLEPLPPQTHLNALIDVYRREIHPLLPIVDFSTPALSGTAVATTDPASVLLKKAICLAACKNASAHPHLYLPDEKGDGGGAGGRPGPPSYVLQTTRDFGDRVFHSLKIALDIGLVDDRLELVQLLALMTFHSYGRDGDDEVARLCGQAVHYAYSAGLHQPSLSSSSSSSAGAGAVPESRRLELLCSVFALITGRPATAYERDMYFPPDRDDAWQSVSPGLRTLFRLSRMLDRVLDLYRHGWPPADSEQREEGGFIWDASWPDNFEDFAKESNIETLAFPLQATLEMLYHTISVMAYRPGRRPATTEPDAPASSQPSPVPALPGLQRARSRHASSAREVLALPVAELVMLPFVPHAVALALAAALRTGQETALETSRRKARADVTAGLADLAELAERYWHAEALGRTARRLVDAAYGDLAQERA